MRGPVRSKRNASSPSNPTKRSTKKSRNAVLAPSTTSLTGASSSKANPPSLPPSLLPSPPPPPPALQAKADTIHRLLDYLYPSPPIPLDHYDNYSLLVAVILSAQTTDGKVNQVTPALFQQAPTPKHLAALPHALVLDLIRPVGLAPGKARNLINMAQKLVDDFGGESSSPSPASGTRRPPWSCPKPLPTLPSPSTRTCTDAPAGGASARTRRT
ncbi:endonuclease iii [Nannochloropsis gaditana]|uniref:Endonuclease iii n=1 Tax=Nannochloropsis gaditana TaxID=72520 RepID=W7TA53_9STRA|nr:endonuclease iii [Nannochloropsis gaditana]